MEKDYKMIWMPNHHRAKVNGMVYEHILMAEEKLGRALRSEEVVHHEDEDKHNNHPDNLYVFATGADHIRFHHTGRRVKVDDYWVSPAITKECAVCNKEFEYEERRENIAKYCSKECRQKSQERVARPSKEELLELIKTKPFVKIGEQYGVSDNAIRKWCKAYDLPYRQKDIKKLK